MYRAMDRSAEPLSAALARLEHRWGNAVIRLGDGRAASSGRAIGPGRMIGIGQAIPDAGALAPVLAPGEASRHPAVIGPASRPGIPVLPAGLSESDPFAAPDPRVASTGFPALDAILGPGGLVREAGVTLRGGESSGKTTLALRCVAEAQRRGAIAAWLDLRRSFDPLEAAARGVDLAWLLVLRSPDAVEGLRLAGALLGGRTVELLVVDLPGRLPAVGEGLLRRLAARARLAGARLLVLEPLGLAAPLRGALAETAGVGLELERHDWIRLGRDVVGQRTLVTVARNRFGPPGRRVELEIRYVDEGDRAPGVERFLDDGPSDRVTILRPPAAARPPQPLSRPSGLARPPRSASPPPGPIRPPAAARLRPPGTAPPTRLRPPPRDPGSTADAPSPSRLAPSASPPRASRPARHPGVGGDRREALGGGDGARLQSRRTPPGHPAGHAAREGASARP
jgi:hypothetical protein